MSQGRKYPRAAAIEVGRELMTELQPLCEDGFFKFAGSLRRRKELVGDVELVYVSRHGLGEVPGELFPTEGAALCDVRLLQLIEAGVLAKREGINGATSWGEKNKFAVHCATGIPIDFFRTSALCFHNFMVCRTGSKVNNERIAMAARDMGWQWKPYSRGFAKLDGRDTHTVQSEQEVYEFVGLPYLEPWERN